MRPIPDKLRKEMADDPFYKKCCLLNTVCQGRIEWHHGIIYAGRQLNEKWAIIPLCHHHHEKVMYEEIKDKTYYIMLNRVSDDELRKYSKAIDYIRLKKILNEKYKSQRNRKSNTKHNL